MGEVNVFSLSYLRSYFLTLLLLWSHIKWVMINYFPPIPILQLEECFKYRRVRKTVSKSVVSCISSMLDNLFYFTWKYYYSYTFLGLYYILTYENVHSALYEVKNVNYACSLICICQRMPQASKLLLPSIYSSHHHQYNVETTSH